MSIIVSFGCVIIVIILMKLMYNMKHRRFYQLLEQFPSYPTYPLIGNINLVFGPSDDFLMKAEKIFLPFDRLVFWLGPRPMLLLRKYDDVKTILSQCLDREFDNLADEWLGIGIITAKYEEWKRSRKMLNPAFSLGMLPKYAKVFNKTASNLVENIKSVADTGEEIDVMDYVLNGNLDAIVENTMGISMKSSGKLGEDFCNAFLEGFASKVLHRVVSPWLHSHHVYMLYLKMTGKIKSIERSQYYARKILNDKLDNIRNQNIQLSDVDSTTTVMDSLLERSIVEPGFSEIRMTDELKQIIISGMDTTTLSLSFLMVMLAIHQDVQQEVYEEILQTTGGDDNITADQSLYKLKYLEQCIRETTRMYAPVAVTSRRTHKECILKGNVIVPANTFVVTMLHFTHRDPELFKNPDKWDPDHFSEQAIAERPKGSPQLSFGFGPRSCIGAKYAMMSVKTQISHILLRYHLSTHIEEIAKNNLTMDLMIRSKIGYPVIFTSRQKLRNSINFERRRISST